MKDTAGRLWLVFVAFVVGVSGAVTSLIISRTLSEDVPLPIAISDESESEYLSDYLSYLEIGSRFPDESYSTYDGSSGSFYDVFKSGPTVLFLWSPACEPCIEQDALWKRVMRPSLLPDVQEVLCLPLHYRDSVDLPEGFTKGRMVVFLENERFEKQYRLIALPTIISLDHQGFITAIQYGYSGAYTKDLIEAVTKFEVGPSVPLVRTKAGS